MIVQLVPEFTELRIGQEKAIEGERNQHLGDNFHAESANGQQPGGQAVRVPQQTETARRHQSQASADGESSSVSRNVWICTRSKAHEYRVHCVVNKVEEAGHQEVNVAAESDKSGSRFERAQAVLERQDDE